ncbi:MAG: PLP-dependent aminotransferase family protein, partial [Cohaesibacteraceae bacterium]|nr:PLP-dependent aminotransferase family protein [Cohaesibacteraceae bacterium]
RQFGVVHFSFLNLDKKSPVPLFQRLNTQIRQAVLSGRLPSGMRLPSSRDLAMEIGVSRTTVVTAFEQLLAEGYLESRTGSGTYVARNLDRNIGELPSSPGFKKSQIDGQASKLSRRGALLAKSTSFIVPEHPTSFLPNQPAFDKFPFSVWSRLVARHNQNTGYNLLNYGNASGYPPLRRAIADYLGQTRGIKCDEGQVIVVTGAQMALGICAWVLLDPGDTVIMEDPSLLVTRDLFRGFGGRIINTPVDKNGMDVNVGIAKAPDARMAVVTPSHQYPLGVTLSLARRLELLAWSNRAKSWIIEDDYDSEFRFSGAPLAPLQTIDQNGRVIYVGSFSKVLFPSLRIGYLVVPSNLVDACSAAVGLFIRNTPTHNQAALAEFIENGHFSTHIRKMRLIYAERQDAIVSAIRKNLDDIIEISPGQAGLNVIGWFREICDDLQAVQRMKSNGILGAAMSPRYAENQPRPGLLLGFGCTPIEKIELGVQKMANALST